MPCSRTDGTLPIGMMQCSSVTRGSMEVRDDAISRGVDFRTELRSPPAPSSRGILRSAAARSNPAPQREQDGNALGQLCRHRRHNCRDAVTTIQKPSLRVSARTPSVTIGEKRELGGSSWWDSSSYGRRRLGTFASGCEFGSESGQTILVRSPEATFPFSSFAVPITRAGSLLHNIGGVHP